MTHHTCKHVWYDVPRELESKARVLCVAEGFQDFASTLWWMIMRSHWTKLMMGLGDFFMLFVLLSRCKTIFWRYLNNPSFTKEKSDISCFEQQSEWKYLNHFPRSAVCNSFLDHDLLRRKDKSNCSQNHKSQKGKPFHKQLFTIKTLSSPTSSSNPPPHDQTLAQGTVLQIGSLSSSGFISSWPEDWEWLERYKKREKEDLLCVNGVTHKYSWIEKRRQFLKNKSPLTNPAQLAHCCSQSLQADTNLVLRCSINAVFTYTHIHINL